ncbi:RagB/SusD family nutrient uptake outer membrane protein [Fulvivirgaceae bacterium BMA12]|uniref:RagB/SusD family nutrient uptake outer membrane protein n=1 Tax=Agaribacillus aureus TaxID=3051825 RepID=A0ABT8L6X4_9BACT|nr:RagB/SusD family nutrient uptake outer membrane protein [Fulvivirgaceae bacterium BMA12]
MENKNIKYIICLVMSFLIGACDFDIPNPNAASEDQVLTTAEGLFALSIGIRTTYSAGSNLSALRDVILTPGVTTRELAITSTFQSLIDLEEGGPLLPNDNGNTTRLFTRLNRVKGMAENLIASAPNVPLIEGTRSGFIAYGHLFKAICLGNLAQNFEQVPIDNSLNNDAAFSPRQAAYEEAIQLLEQAISLINTTPISSEFSTTVLAGNIDLGNTLNAYLSRYNLFAGNYQAAIDAADAVDLSSTSIFSFDGENLNPIFDQINNGPPSYTARQNFGTPLLDPADGRLDFYTELYDPVDSTNQNGLPIARLKGFFGANDPIPVYVPGEVLLNKAEALARLNQLNEAITEINKVRTKTDDPFGINADLPAYGGAITAEAVLEEIFLNRRAELFLTGVSLEDSRRFGRPEPPATPDLSSERNRNFYPYPLEERLNNPNTPDDPGI